MRCSFAEMAVSRSAGTLNVRSLLARLGMLILLSLAAGRTSAQTLTTLCSFSGSNGFQPETALTLIGSTLYGTTARGADRLRQRQSRQRLRHSLQPCHQRRQSHDALLFQRQQW